MRKWGLCAQEALALEDGEVETWVIRASGKKLLEARIDQLRSCVAVTRIPPAHFHLRAVAPAFCAAGRLEGVLLLPV